MPRLHDLIPTQGSLGTARTSALGREVPWIPDATRADLERYIERTNKIIRERARARRLIQLLDRCTYPDGPFHHPVHLTIRDAMNYVLAEVPDDRPKKKLRSD
jgi:hypothetical protein